MKMENETNETAIETTTESTEVMGKKLKAAGKLAETQQKQRRERTVKGSHLLGTLQDRAKSAGLTVEEQSGYLKITGSAKGRGVYVARKGGRVNLGGFTVQAPAVKQISEDEARAKHLGKVRGQLDLDQPDDAILSAYELALAELKAAPAAE